MNKVFRGIAAALVLLFMLITYISGSIALLLGIGYYTAFRNNGLDITDYTQTGSFRRITREILTYIRRRHQRQRVEFPYGMSLLISLTAQIRESRPAATPRCTMYRPLKAYI